MFEEGDRPSGLSLWFKYSARDLLGLCPGHRAGISGVAYSLCIFPKIHSEGNNIKDVIAQYGPPGIGGHPLSAGEVWGQRPVSELQQPSVSQGRPIQETFITACWCAVVMVEGGRWEQLASRVLGRLHRSPSSKLSFEEAEAVKGGGAVSARWEEQERERMRVSRK